MKLFWITGRSALSMNMRYNILNIQKENVKSEVEIEN